MTRAKRILAAARERGFFVASPAQQFRIRCELAATFKTTMHNVRSALVHPQERGGVRRQADTNRPGLLAIRSP